MADSSASKRSRSEISGNAATGAIGLPNRIGRSSIFFGSDFADRDVRLIEISEELLKQLDSRDSLKIIGPVEASSSQGATDAVLTSKNKTFSIKKVETSNAVYLVDPSKSETYRIQSASQDYYELKSIPPRIERIKELCAEYDGISEDLNSDTVPPLLSYDELRCQIQASDEEFESSLFKLAIVKLNGKMRCLSKIAIRETIQKLLLTIMEERWDINCINENLCVRNIPDTDPILLNFSLQSLGEKISVSGDKMGQGQGQGQGQEPSIWTLDHNTIARSTAHRLFNSQSDPMMV